MLRLLYTSFLIVWMIYGFFWLVVEPVVFEMEMTRLQEKYKDEHGNPL